MTRPTSVVLGLSAAAAALSLTIVNAPGAASAATHGPQTALPAALRTSAAPDQATPTIPAHAVLTAVTSPGRSTIAAQPATAPAHHAAVQHYTVQPGDSFWSIAHAHNVDWYNLAADNHLEMYSVLVAGQVLALPPAGQAPHAAMPLEPGTVLSSSPTTTSSTSSAVSSYTPSAPAASSSDDSSFEQCVISRESGGNAEVTNGGGYWGLFQFSPSTWAAYGGDPGAFGSASAGAQEQVFDNAMAAGGESNWAPYDGC